MERRNLYQPFEVKYQRCDSCPLEKHTHTFFELVYIVAGKGLQCVNKHVSDYREGHLFLITPKDCHSFDVHTTTAFTLIRFSNIYLDSYRLSTEERRRMVYILENASHRPGCVFRDASDQLLAQGILEGILREHLEPKKEGEELIRQLIFTLLVIVARNLTPSVYQIENPVSGVRSLDMLEYIQKHICEPEKLRSGNLAAKFGISEFYLGRFFKKHTKETLRQYISGCRRRYIERRLTETDMRINEIAAEMGFTDESHLNKFFRRHTGLSPGAYRLRHTTPSAAMEGPEKR